MHDNYDIVDEVIKNIAQTNPDIILLCGDIINKDARSNTELTSFIKILTSIAPVYYALGNHELENLRNNNLLLDEIERAGAKVLEKTYCDVIINNSSIRIGAMYDYAFALDDENSTKQENMPKDVFGFLSEFQNTESFTLMLSHRPESFVLGEASKTWDIDLVVSGHDHGGQVVLPFLGGLWAGDQGWFPEYVHGLHQKDKLNILITSGLGSHVQKLPRFNNPPEVVVCTISPKE